MVCKDHREVQGAKRSEATYLRHVAPSLKGFRQIT
jgi:hypothetical protein